VEAIAETISENDPASQRYQAGLRDDGIHVQHSRTYQPLLASVSPGSQGKSDRSFKELCRGLNARDFSYATQERFVSVLCDVCQPTGRPILCLLQQVRSALQITFLLGH
jgi:hypothetical protein